MPYCSNCGNPYELGKTTYCPKCGDRLTRGPTGSSSAPLVLLILGALLLLAVLSPFAYRWLFGECGAVKVARAMSEFSRYEAQLADVEKEGQIHIRPPAYLLTRLDGSMMSLSSRSYDKCLEPASREMVEALLFASNYYANRSQESGSPRAEEDRIEYASHLRLYYRQIENLRACQPFCNLDAVFKLTSERPLPP